MLNWIGRGCVLTALVASVSCGSSEDSDSEGSTGGGGNSRGTGGSSSADASGPAVTDPGLGNEYSWDGSWAPAPSDFPLEGMSDETYPDLPPGKWGWDNACDCPGDAGLDIYENEFKNKGLDFEPLEDEDGHRFGWRLVDVDGGGIALDHRGDNFEGSSGTDILDLNPDGELASTGPNDQGSPGINLGDGPDMLRYCRGWSVDMRMGSDERGSLRDDDLAVIGSESVLGTNEYDISGTTIHTGPGSDLVLARNVGQAAIDLGNGGNGRTDTLDPTDGDDMVVLAGNMRDFRVYGGYGDDVFVWYVLDVDDDGWLGPNFFGGGGWGDAVWGDPGTDRLILAVPPDTGVVSRRADHDGNWGSFLVMLEDPYYEVSDAPTESDAFARYYQTVPEGPSGEHTVTLSYRAADQSVFTQDFYATSVEEIQLGVEADAVVYRVDPVTGSMVRAPELEPLTELPVRSEFNALFDTFARE